MIKTKELSNPAATRAVCLSHDGTGSTVKFHSNLHDSSFVRLVRDGIVLAFYDCYFLPALIRPYFASSSKQLFILYVIHCRSSTMKVRSFNVYLSSPSLLLKYLFLFRLQYYTNGNYKITSLHSILSLDSSLVSSPFS